MSSKCKPERLDPVFKETLRAIAQERILKGLSKALPYEMSFAEQTRLLMKTDGWKMAINELRTKPKNYKS